MVSITRTSKFSGITRTLELDITQQQMDNYINGMHIHKAFPNLSADQREFILTGCTKEEWDEMFPPEDIDDDYDGSEDY